jgi:P-type Ca2+ transporter type 2C
MVRRIPPALQDMLRNTSGLSAAEAEERLAQFGPNDILGERRNPLTQLAWDTAKDPMLWFLALTSLLFFAVGDIAEGIVMALAVVPILGMDAFLHRRTLASTEGLAGELAASATIVRDGEQKTVPSRDIVPGDIIIVHAGESFSADGRVLDGAGLQADESTLTGESIPVPKRPGPIDRLEIADENWAMAGTRLLTGTATVQAVLTAAATTYGEIVRTTRESAQQPTQLQTSVNRLVTILAAAAVLMCVVLAVTRYWTGHGLMDAFISGATLAVAALPEEFPVVLTFFVGMGVLRMARRKALVRRAAAVEHIGRVTCICSDKTGTLTEGRLRIAEVLPARGVQEAELVRTIALAARPDSGDPLDAAMLQLTPEGSDKVHEVFPFTEDRRREAIVRESGEGKYVTVLKGAPETVIPMCKMHSRAHKEIMKQVQTLAASGYKVIAIASQSAARSPGHEPVSGFHFYGLLAFEDPVRPEVPAAVAWAQASGIKVILVTGDHAATARAVAIKAGIGSGEPIVVSGDEMPVLMRNGKPIEFDVVARATPLQKLDLVSALQKRKETVVATGDGVNDVPALNGADVSIAMGERGSRPARETAMIVLLNDSFSTIVNAIREGRDIFWNLRASFAYLLIMHVPIVLAAAVVPMAGYPLLFLPVHVVWLELIMHPTAILAFRGQSNESGESSRATTGARIFNLTDAFLIGVGGLSLTIAAVGGYLHALGPENSFEHARALGMATLIIGSCAVSIALMGARDVKQIAVPLAALLLSILAIENSEMASLLHVSQLHLSDWLLAWAGALPAAAAAAALSRRRRA